MPKKESVPHNVIHLTANKTLKYILCVCIYFSILNIKYIIHSKLFRAAAMGLEFIHITFNVKAPYYNNIYTAAAVFFF